MSETNNLDKEAVYFIPNNFAEGGTLFGGALKIRNAIEAGIWAFAVGYPLYELPIPVKIKIILMIILCLPVSILALIGINKGPLSEWIVDVFKYKRLNHHYEIELIFNNENKEGGNDNGKKNQ